MTGSGVAYGKPEADGVESKPAQRLQIATGRQELAEKSSPAAPMRYLVFVFFLIIVLVFAHLSHRGMQERLGDQLMLATATALQLDTNGVPRDPRFREVSYEVSHMDVVLKGKVDTPELRDELLKLIREGIPAGRLRYRGLKLEQALQPELVAVMTPGKVTLEGRVPTEELALRLRQSLLGMGVFVSAQNLRVDDKINTEDWLNRADAVVAQFFQGATEGEFVLRNGVLRLKRAVGNPMEVELVKAEMAQWLPAGRYQVAVDGLQILKAVRPVELAIRKVEGKWILNGQLPDGPALASITRVLEEADAPARVDASGVTVDPSLERPKWLQNGRIERFLKVYAKRVQENPEIIIRAGGVVLKGTATDFIARSNLPSFAGEAFGYGVEIDQEGVRLASSSQANREQWLRIDVSQETVVLSGTLPTEQARNDLSGSIAKAYPGAQIKNSDLQIQAAAPPAPWLPALGTYFTDLAALTSQKGSIDIAGREAYLGGMARTEWSRNALVGKLEQALGPDFQVFDQLLVDPRGETAVSGEAIKIYFPLGSRQVGKDQEAKIAAAADRIRQAGSTSGILGLIKGYASPGGSAEYNIKLSGERAMAVYEALIGRGVSPVVLKILTEGVDPHLTGEEARRVEIFIR